MNCQQAQTWILQSEAPAATPALLAEHLRTCGHCKSVHDQLLTLERQLQTAPLPGMPLHLKNALMESLVPVAQATVVTRSTAIVRRRRRMRSEHVVGYTVAAAASVVVGVVLGYALAGRDTTPVAHTLPTPTAPLHKPAPAVAVKPKPEKPVPAVGPSETLVQPSEVIGSTNTLVKPPPATTIVETPVPMVDPEVTSPNVVPRPATETKSPLANAKFLTDDELLAQLIENHTDLSSVVQPADRLARLAALSDVIWSQAIKESQVGGMSNVPWLEDAYAGIVEIDLPAIAKELGPDDQAKAEALAVTLEERGAEVGRLLADAPPTSSRVFKQLQSVAESGAQKLIKKGRDPLTRRPRLSGGSSTLLPLIVQQTSALARESNPLERADHSTALAEGLAKDIVLTALRGEEDRAAALGQHFGKVLEQGIVVNLKRLDPKTATYQQSRRYQQVVARTQTSIVFLQQSLEAAPVGARGGLERAMEQGGLAQLVPPPGPKRRGWVWTPKHLEHLKRWIELELEDAR
jgi:hypothetical protein